MSERKVNHDTITDWMAERGEFSYANRIATLKTRYHFNLDPFVIDELIREVQQEAMDRYNDWVSDPLD